MASGGVEGAELPLDDAGVCLIVECGSKVNRCGECEAVFGEAKFCAKANVLVVV